MTENFIRCRDCKHWKLRNGFPHNSLELYGRDVPADKGWVEGVCRRIRDGVAIEASGGWDGATVDGAFPDANFSCLFGEKA